jgi:hypothetical protein
MKLVMIVGFEKQTLPHQSQTVRSTVFPNHSIHKYILTPPDVKTHNQIDHMLIDERWDSDIVVSSCRGADYDTIIWWLHRTVSKYLLSKSLIWRDLMSRS